MSGTPFAPASGVADPADDPNSDERSRLAQAALPARDLNDRLVLDLIDAVKAILRKETSDRLRDVYLIGDIEKDTARSCHRAPARAGERQQSADHALHQQRRRQRHRRPCDSRLDPPDRQPRHRGDDRRPGHGVLDGIRRAAGGQRGPSSCAAALVDHDPRAGEVGGLAVDVGRGAAPRSPEADAGADLRDSRRSGRAGRCKRSSATRSGPISISMRRRRWSTD